MKKVVSIMNGHDEEATNARLIKKALLVYANIDKLFTAFVPITLITHSLRGAFSHEFPTI